ncbi:hypothetical protein DNTS_025550, partial [Danionella cerebrum]
GCQCPPGLFLENGRCVNSSECECLWEGMIVQPGQRVSNHRCSLCVCKGGRVICDESSCVAHCDWSAWSSWTSCDSSCGDGVQHRYRSPLSAVAAVRVEPCEGDSTEARRCYSPCTDRTEGLWWSEWTAWSECSKTCFHHVDAVGLRRRFRSCNHTLIDAHSICGGDAEENEPCNTLHCPVNGMWSTWSSWSTCSSPCDSGVQTRDRSCSAPPPLYGGLLCPGPHIQTRDCNALPCSGVCPKGMTFLSKQGCEAQGGACPRVCLDAMEEVECASECYDGCYCSSNFYLFNNTCVSLDQCPCFHEGTLYRPGDRLPYDRCNNCENICQSPLVWQRVKHEGQPQEAAKLPQGDWGNISTTRPDHVIRAIRKYLCERRNAVWKSTLSCRTCDVGIRRRYRSGTNPAPAFGGQLCKGERIELDTCSVKPCFDDGNVCSSGQRWTECVRHQLLCSDLGFEVQGDAGCHPGCQCPEGSALQGIECVPLSRCHCHIDGEQYHPGATVRQHCNNCTCESGKLVNCTNVECNGKWMAAGHPGLPGGGVQSGAVLVFSHVSASVLNRLQLEMVCPALDQNEKIECVFLLPAAVRDGGWSDWTSWMSCSKSCGGGVRSRRRHCNQPITAADGDYCEGLDTECNHLFAVSSCSHIPGSVFSACGPSCPRSCDDLTFCQWRCEPGCYCTEGKVLSSNGTECVEREACSCLDLNTGRRVRPGETILTPDACNNCTCNGGKLSCSENPCPVTRFRSCSCPESRSGGAMCLEQQEEQGGVGVQIQRKNCSSISFCPVHGSWGTWSSWSACDPCAGVSVRQRECNSPPARFGGRSCAGVNRQSRGCSENNTVCSDCGGGQEDWKCGKPCPRSCSDLHGDTECLDLDQCSQTCGCPSNTLMQDGVCVEPDLCRCKHHNTSSGVTQTGDVSWTGDSNWYTLSPGETISDLCHNWFFLARVMLESFCVNLFLVVKSMVDGVNGLPGPVAPPSAGVESGPDCVSVITRPLRAKVETVWEQRDRRVSATHITVQCQVVSGLCGQHGPPVQSAVVEDLGVAADPVRTCRAQG